MYFIYKKTNILKISSWKNDLCNMKIQCNSKSYIEADNLFIKILTNLEEFSTISTQAQTLALWFLNNQTIKN